MSSPTPEEKPSAYEKQLSEWLAGRPFHDGEKSAPDSQCCPDFSCCGGMLAPLEERERFAAYYREHGDPPFDLLSTFLSRMMERHAQGKNVHIAGREDHA